MLNYIWLGLILGAVLIAGVTGRIGEATEGAIKSAEVAVTIALGLIGIMALWLGIMRLAEKSGLVRIIASALRPVMTRLFPDVPAEHPAMGAMLMNIAANMLGLANAATPLGLRAMRDLERLNPHPGTATNAMCTFLAINTSSVQLLPATAVAILASAGSTAPTAIIGTAFAATLCSTAAGITSVKLLERLPGYRLAPAPTPVRVESAEAVEENEAAEPPRPLEWWGMLILAALGLFVLWLLLRDLSAAWAAARDSSLNSGEFAKALLVSGVESISLLAIPVFLAFFPLYAALRGLKVYEEFVEGAKEGFDIAVRIIPFLVTILVAIGMFRGAGGIDIITGWLRPFLERVGFPADLLPMVLMRPLSGSGTLGLFTDLVKTLGPDALVSRMAATIFGSTETTFYVVAVYFGSVAVRRTRHAIPAGLIADLTGVIAAVIICRLVFA